MVEAHLGEIPIVLDQSITSNGSLITPWRAC